MKFNPFAMASHNEWRLPRIAFHASHVLMGVPVWALARATHAPLWAVLVAAVLLSVLGKFTWLDWKRTSGTFLHFPVSPAPIDWPDMVSDTGLTVLGALLPAPLVFAVVYYVLSTVNDP